MAKNKSITKKRVITDSITIEGFLSLDNLQGFCVDTEDNGLKDVSNDIKELNGELVKITINSVNKEDLTDVGFSNEEE